MNTKLIAAIATKPVIHSSRCRHIAIKHFAIQEEQGYCGRDVSRTEEV